MITPRLVNQFFFLRNGSQVSDYNQILSKIRTEEDVLKKLAEINKSPSVFVYIMTHKTLTAFKLPTRTITVEISSTPFTKENEDSFESIVVFSKTAAPDKIEFLPFSFHLSDISEFLEAYIIAAKECIRLTANGHEVYYLEPVIVEDSQFLPVKVVSNKETIYQTGKTIRLAVIDNAFTALEAESCRITKSMILKQIAKNKNPLLGLQKIDRAYRASPVILDSLMDSSSDSHLYPL